jgi:hypothetical protein
VLNLNDISWSSRQVPVGNDSPIEVATLTVEAPTWISPPVKVKRLGVMTKIVSNVWNTGQHSNDSYIEGLAFDPIGPTQLFSNTITTLSGTAQNNTIEVYANKVILLNHGESVFPNEPTLDAEPVRRGTPLSWLGFLSTSTGKYVAGVSMIYLTQPNGTYVVGTFAINALDETVLTVEWNPDTLTGNTGIDSAGKLEDYPGYNSSASYRPNSPGTFDAIINPQKFNPTNPTAPVAGTRYLIIEDVGAAGDENNTQAWGALVAVANDIIEYSGTAWHVIFNANQETTTMVWQTNIYTGVQYLWDGIQWKKSFEGEYTPALWKIVL